MRSSTRGQGFTLVEIMVVVAIIGLLACISVPSLIKARVNSKINKAKNDIRVIAEAIDMLAFHTAMWPGGANAGEEADQEFWDLSVPAAGIVATDGTFPRWQGPYLDLIPEDPWGNTYFFDPDYEIDGVQHQVVGSFGPNGVGPNMYDADDIYILIDQ